MQARPYGKLTVESLQRRVLGILDQHGLDYKLDWLHGTAPFLTAKGELVGGLGVSGDTACADHVVAWKTRRALKLDTVPMGVAQGPSDNLILDLQNGVSPSGFGHPSCKGGQPADDIIKNLNSKEPVGPKH